MKAAAAIVLAALAVLLGAACAAVVFGCARPAPRDPREHPVRVGPPPLAQQDGTAIPAWNVGGTVYVACGAGGKACR